MGVKQMSPIESWIRQHNELLDKPFFIFREHMVKKAVHFFRSMFRAKVLYAVKTNPEKHILSCLSEQGINDFDVASLEEIRHVSSCIAHAQLHFMHPIKSRHAIREAYFTYGVRHFSLDSEQELEKILQETNNATDLHLHMRLAIPNSYAEHNLSDKFGISLHMAPKLLQKTRKHAQQLGICFHVGSQCMHPDAYRIAIRMAKKVMRQANVPIEIFNVGGGFPSIYPGMIPPPLTQFFNAIHEEIYSTPSCKNMQLLCEPGRALVAESASLIVRVDLRKDDMLYINDGTYGSLFDAGIPQFIFPVRLIRPENLSSTDVVPFSFYGPTCDSLDYMRGPFYLPNDIQEGDYIEIGQMGAYGRTMASSFNGFAPAEEIVYTDDEPLMTMYQGADISETPLEIIAA